MSDTRSELDVSRRQFLKASGATGAVLGSAGLGLFGYAAGQDPNSYLGWQTYEGVNQYFNRSRWAVDSATYETVGPTSRPDARTENIFARRGRLFRQHKDGGLEELDELLQAHYQKRPEDYELDIINMTEILPKKRADNRTYGKRFHLAEAWADAMWSVSPDRITEPPEVADFPSGERHGEPDEPLKMKSPEQSARLIKKIAHELGSTLVGIAKLNPDWVYLHPLRGRGFDASWIYGSG